jgi:hypothetical protein
MGRPRVKPLSLVKFTKVRPVKKERATALGDFAGAVKVCVRYGRKAPESKTRCLQWMAGPGYAEGPSPRGTKTDPKYFVEEARFRDDGTKISRPYRYRTGTKPLPYPPRTKLVGGKKVFNPLSVNTQARWDDLPDSVKEQVLQLVGEGAIPELTPQEILSLQRPRPDLKLT